MKTVEEIDVKTVATVMEWQSSDIVASPMVEFSKGRNKSSDFKHGDSFLSVQTIFSNAKAKTNKVVDRKFNQWLQNGENGITYSLVEGTNEAQIFGTKNGPGGMTIFILRKSGTTIAWPRSNS